MVRAPVALIIALMLAGGAVAMENFKGGGGWDSDRWSSSSWNGWGGGQGEWHDDSWSSGNDDGAWAWADPAQLRSMDRKRKGRTRSPKHMGSIFEVSDQDDDEGGSPHAHPGTARGCMGDSSEKEDSPHAHPGTARGCTGGGGEEGDSRTVLTCCERACGFASHVHTMFVPVDMDDWQEKHRTRCFPCSKVCDPEVYGNVTEARFKKMAKALWRKKTHSEKAKTRGIKLKEELAKCDGMTNKAMREARRSILVSVAHAVASFVASILKLREEEIVGVEDAFEAWGAECERSIADPTYVSRFSSAGCHVLDSTMQFASEITDRISDYFVCRTGPGHADTFDKPCGYFGPNANWVATKQALAALGGGWRCPVCGNEYVPWKSKPSYFKANKIMVIETDGMDMGQLKALGLNADATVSEGKRLEEGDGACSVKFIPFQWEDTKTVALVNRLKQLHLEAHNDGLKDEILLATHDCVAELSLQQDPEVYKQVRDLAHKAAVKKAYFADLRITPAAREKIEEANARALAKGEDWKTYVMEHLEEGFKGNRYMWTPDDEVMSAKDMARFWSTMRVGLQRARAMQSYAKK